MISIDTNILLPAIESTNADHQRAAAFLASLHDRDDVAISEFVLLELYGLLRNPAVLVHPATPRAAVAACDAFRGHPRWQLVGFPADSRGFHDDLWRRLREPGLPRRRAYDLRLALSLVAQGIDEFATANVRDFQSAGFTRVFNPLR